MLIDLRSDTVTQPCSAMRQAMASAPVGDDVYGDDPTVNLLEETAADMVDMESALYFPTGTQANLVALLSHCQRGEEYIVGQQAHNYRYEAGGAAVLGSIQPQPINAETDGTLSLTKIRDNIKPDDAHFAKTRLISLENTHSGLVLPLPYLQQAYQLSRDHQLALHLDGARIFNAVVAAGYSLTDVTKCCDTISICLSKGLGAPVGSLLCGSAELIQRARRWRKMVGGGMRQSGIMAAAGLYALQNNITQLQKDHANAQWLAEQLLSLGLTVIGGKAQTNMLFVQLSTDYATQLGQWMKQRGVLINAGATTRLVTHLGVSREDLEKVVAYWRAFSEQQA